jgi:hypothetical protein
VLSRGFQLAAEHAGEFFDAFPSGTISKWARKLEAAGLIAIRNRMYYAVEAAA